jgi:hypothetical protein
MLPAIPLPWLRAVAKRLPVIPVFLAGGLALCAEKTVIQIVPGPKVMTAEEKALVPDPARGAEHGIVLVDETVRDEYQGTESNVTRHIRAKIFSNEARNLADIEIPFNRDLGLLKKWWGVTLLPDGTALETTQTDLKQHEVARVRGSALVKLKASLPGVVPGCVIDYGYQYQERGFYQSLRVDIQSEAPVKEFRYRWVPYMGRTAAYGLVHTQGLTVDARLDRSSVLVTGKDLPAVLEEPFMPPDDEARGSVIFYYRNSGEKPADFWDLEAKRLFRRAAEFAKEKPVSQLVASMNLPAGAGLMARLQSAYDWAAANFKNTTLRMTEEAEVDDSDQEKKPAGWRTVADVIKEKEAASYELDFLFFGMARALGADVSMIRATDRTDHYFNPGFLSLDQFNWTLVGVKAKGDPDEKLVFVDLGSGLPFGEIPWWLSGSRALLAAPEGHRIVPLYPSDPKKNLRQAKAKMSFNLADMTASLSWTIDGAGQQGLKERWRLRGLGPEERQKALDRECGGWGDMEISRAVAPRLQDLMASYHLECAGTQMNTNFHSGLGRYTFHFLGPWSEAPPRFAAPTRIQNAIFPFPAIESLILDVRSPEGFVPEAVAPVAPVESLFGKYALSISTTPEGYHVERLLALSAIVVPPKDYDTLRRFFTEVARADETRLVFKSADLP